MQITTDEIQGEASAEYFGTQWKSCLQIFIHFVFLFGSGGDSDHGEPGGFEEGLAVAETSAERRITRNLPRVFQSGVFISRGSDSSLTHWRHMGCLLSDSVTRDSVIMHWRKRKAYPELRHVWRYSDILHLGKKKKKDPLQYQTQTGNITGQWWFIYLQ